MPDPLREAFLRGFADEAGKLGMRKAAQGLGESLATPGVMRYMMPFGSQVAPKAATGFGGRLLGFGKSIISPITAAAGTVVAGGAMALGALAKPKNMSWRQWMPKGTFQRTLGHFTGLPLGGEPNAPIRFRPPTISGLGHAAMAGQQPPGAF